MDGNEATSPSSSVLSIAIEVNKIKHLRKLDQNVPLNKIIEEICIDQDEGNPGDYGLQFDQHPKHGYKFISEENRQDIINGSICRLVHSPTVLVRQLLATLISATNDGNKWSLDRIISFLHDKVFVDTFIEEDGITVLITLINKDKLSIFEKGLAFHCFAVLLKDLCCKSKNVLDLLKGDFITHVIYNITTQQKRSHKTQESCLTIANYLITNYNDEFPILCEVLTIIHIDPYLAAEDFNTKIAALTLINTLLNIKSKRKSLVKDYAKSLRQIIYKHIISVETKLNNETKKELAKFQFRFIDRLRRKAESPVDMNDNIVKKRINMLSQLKLEEENQNNIEIDEQAKRNTLIENNIDLLNEYSDVPPPAMDDNMGVVLPPSILVLDCMTHFVKTYIENYKAVLEFSKKSKDYPFVELCTELVNLLTDSLGITKHINEDNLPYYPVLYSTDKAFEEIFCVTVMIYFKTAKEMRAGKLEYKKVINTIKKKIEVTLSEEPTDIKTFGKRYYQLKYKDISDIWEKEREAKELEIIRETSSILKLKESYREECNETIKQQRLHVLSQGGYFIYYPKQKPKGRGVHIKYVECNHRFEFTDDNDKINNFTVELSKVKSIVTGPDCTHVKSKGINKTIKPECAFSLILTDGETINLSAFKEEQLDRVLDSFKLLLGLKMESKSYEEDLKMLLDMEIRLNLLDAHGVELPNSDPPPIPPDPNNYNFPDENIFML